MSARLSASSTGCAACPRIRDSRHDQMPSATTPARVVVAGRGVGALEAVLALRALAGGRVSLELVAPETSFVERPLAVAAPFEIASPERRPLARLKITHRVRHRTDRLAGIDAARRRVYLAGAGEISYEVVVVATGAHGEPWLEGALTSRGPSDAPAASGQRAPGWRRGGPWRACEPLAESPRP